MTSGGSVLARAAASSIASGRQSSRRQISSTSATSPDVGLHRCGTLDEELDRVLLRQRCDRVLVLAAQVERRAAGRQHAQAGRSGEQLGDERCRLEEVLEVVQDEEQLA